MNLKGTLMQTCLQVKNSISQISHCHTFHFFKYAQSRYAKCLFTNKREPKEWIKKEIEYYKNTQIYFQICITLRFFTSKQFISNQSSNGKLLSNFKGSVLFHLATIKTTD